VERRELAGDPDRRCGILSGDGRGRVTYAPVQRAPHVVVERCDGGDTRALRVHVATITTIAGAETENLSSLTGRPLKDQT
jgi:hypothetical protein